MSCINHYLHLSQIKTMRAALEQLRKQCAEREISIGEFIKQKKTIQIKINNLLTYFDIHESELYKLGAILRERLNLKKVSDFKNGRARATDWDGRKFYLDTKGIEVSEPKQMSTSKIERWKPEIDGENGKWYFTTEYGAKLNDEEYDEVWSFSNGRARVNVGNNYHYITEDGTKLNDDEYDYTWNFSNGRGCVQVGNYYHYITEEGVRLNSEEYDKMMDFSNGRAAVGVGNKWHFITEEGSKLNDEEYDAVGRFSNGRAPVTQNSRKYLIDINGKEIEKK